MKQAGPRDWSPPENNNYRPADSYRYPSNQSTTTFAPRKLVRNGPARLSLLFGIIAAGLALFPIASAGAGNGYIASTVGITAIAYGFYALRLRHYREATARLSPIIGILLGAFGTLLMTALVANFYLNGAALSSPITFQVAQTEFTFDSEGLAVSEPAESTVTSGTGQTAEIITPAPVAARASFASSDEERMALIQHLGTVQFVLKQIAPQSKPASLNLATPGGTLSTPDGHALTVLPEGTVVNYAPSADGSNYVMTLKGATFGSMVQLDTAVGQIVALN